MTPDVAVDIGNSRMKWWFCGHPAHQNIVHRLDAEDFTPAANLLDSLGPLPPQTFAIGSVHPKRTQQLTNWLTARGHSVLTLKDRHRLGLKIRVDKPERVGLDRLLNAVAAKQMRLPNRPVIIADVGTASTVDFLDESGAFQGGAIYPGPELMVRSLHQNTAQLPMVDFEAKVPPLPAKNTSDAIHTGVIHAVIGGIVVIARHMAVGRQELPEVFLTGGGALHLQTDLQDLLDFPLRVEPFLTLEGIRLAAELLP